MVMVNCDLTLTFKDVRRQNANSMKVTMTRYRSDSGVRSSGFLKKQTKESKPEASKPPYIALVGPVGSGKTTIARHIHHLFSYQFGFADHIINKRTAIIFSTVIETMQELIKTCEKLDILFETQELEVRFYITQWGH